MNVYEKDYNDDLKNYLILFCIFLIVTLAFFVGGYIALDGDYSIYAILECFTPFMGGFFFLVLFLLCLWAIIDYFIPKKYKVLLLSKNDELYKGIEITNMEFRDILSNEVNLYCCYCIGKSNLEIEHEYILIKHKNKFVRVESLENSLIMSNDREYDRYGIKKIRDIKNKETRENAYFKYKKRRKNMVIFMLVDALLLDILCYVLFLDGLSFIKNGFLDVIYSFGYYSYLICSLLLGLNLLDLIFMNIFITKKDLIMKF